MPALERRSPVRRGHVRLGHRLQRRYRHERERVAGREPGRAMVLEADLGRDQSDRRGQAIRRRQRAAFLRQLGRIELGKRRRTGPQPHPDPDRADPLLEHDQSVPMPGRRRGLELGKQRGRADGRMSGEGHLYGRSEDAHARRVRVVLRLGDEHGLGQVELARDRLHARRVEAVGVEHNGQRVAAEPLVGEHVEDVIGQAHRRHSLTLGRAQCRIPRAFPSCSRRYARAASSAGLLNFLSRYFRLFTLCPVPR